MLIKRSDRFLIVGRSGSGKSVLARALFESVGPPRCVIDPKDDPATTGGAFADRRVAVTFHDPARLPDAEVIRFVPRDPADLEAYDRVYRELFERPGVFVWADEASWPLPARGAPPAAGKLIAQGRVRGIGHLALHQRPVEVARIVPANSEHLVAFDIGHPDDVQTMAKAIGIDPAELAADLRSLPPHGFAWYSARDRTLTVCDPIRRR